MKDPKLVAASAIALAVTLFAIFSMRPLARRFGLVDRPGGRKQHRGSIPLVGGLCFFLGTLVGLSYLGYFDRFAASLMVGGTLIVAAGVLDDAIGLSVRSRLTIEACAVGLVIAMSGFYVRDLGHLLGSQGLGLGWLGIPFTIVAVIGLVNAFNMLDGIDGLAAAVAMVAIAAILLFDNRNASVPGVLLLLQVLFAALIPYLCVNLGWPDGRKVFMGDAGSTVIGFLLAWSLIFLSHNRIGRLHPVDVLWCVAVPVLDTASVMYQRMRAGRSPFLADRRHLHYLLLDAGVPPRLTLVLITAYSGLLVMLGYGLRDTPDWVSALAFLAVLAAHVLGMPRLLARLDTTGWYFPLLEGKARVAIGGGGNDDGANPAAPLAATIEPTAVAAGEPVRALCVLGSSPDAVRMAPIAQRLTQDERFAPTVCVSAEPEQTATQVLSLFDLEPDLRVELPASEDPATITPAALGGMQQAMQDARPDLVLVPGDTAATLPAILAAHSRHVPVICIDRDTVDDANRDEANEDPARHIARVLADLHLAPSESVGRQLVADGVSPERVMVTGDTSLDTLHAAMQRLHDDDDLAQRLAQRYAFLRDDRPLLLAGQARNGGAADAARALREVARRRPDVDVLCLTTENGAASTPANLHAVDPPGYLESVYLLQRAQAVFADRAIETEAAALGVPVLSDAAVPNAPNGDAAIAGRLLSLLGDGSAHDGAASSSDIRNEGDACLRIVDALAGLCPANTASGIPVRDTGSPAPAEVRSLWEAS